MKILTKTLESFLPILGIPIMLFLGVLILRLLHRAESHPIKGITISWMIAGILFGLLIVLVMIEYIQDQYYDRWYRSQRIKPIPLSGAFLECQYCGYQKVKRSDQQCPACGKVLDQS